MKTPPPPNGTAAERPVPPAIAPTTTRLHVTRDQGRAMLTHVLRQPFTLGRNDRRVLLDLGANADPNTLATIAIWIERARQEGQAVETKRRAARRLRSVPARRAPARLPGEQPLPGCPADPEGA